MKKTYKKGDRVVFSEVPGNKDYKLSGVIDDVVMGYSTPSLKAYKIIPDKDGVKCYNRYTSDIRSAAAYKKYDYVKADLAGGFKWVVLRVFWDDNKNTYMYTLCNAFKTENDHNITVKESDIYCSINVFADGTVVETEDKKQHYILTYSHKNDGTDYNVVYYKTVNVTPNSKNFDNFEYKEISEKEKLTPVKFIVNPKDFNNKCFELKREAEEKERLAKMPFTVEQARDMYKTGISSLVSLAKKYYTIDEILVFPDTKEKVNKWLADKDNYKNLVKYVNDSGAQRFGAIPRSFNKPLYISEIDGNSTFFHISVNKMEFAYLVFLIWMYLTGEDIKRIEHSFCPFGADIFPMIRPNNPQYKNYHKFFNVLFEKF